MKLRWMLLGAAASLVGLAIGAKYWQLAAKESKFVRLEKQIFTTFPLTESEAGYHLPLTIQLAPARCHLGDYDAMELANQLSENTFLITLETPPDQATHQVIAKQKISLSDIASGATLEFAVPKISAHYALYICRDGLQKGSCNGKPPISMNDLFGAYYSDGEAFEQFEVDDVIYFYQSLVVRDPFRKAAHAMFLTQSILEEKDKKNLLKPYAHHIFLTHSLSNQQAVAQAKASLGTQWKLESRALEAGDKGILLVLPKLAAECDKEIVRRLYRK